MADAVHKYDYPYKRLGYTFTRCGLMVVAPRYRSIFRGPFAKRRRSSWSGVTCKRCLRTRRCEEDLTKR